MYNIQKKYLTIGILGLIFMSILSPLEAFGQSDSPNIPNSIDTNCLMKDDIYIDSCPNFWVQARTINQALSNLIQSQENKTDSKQSLNILVSNIQIKLQTIKKELFISKKLDKTNSLVIDYMSYILRLYQQELQKSINTKGVIASLFSKTYFDDIQEGLSVTTIALYSNTNPRVYDEELNLKVEIRNFDNTIYTKIEDVYCYDKIGNSGYIFPLGIGNQIFQANHISEIVGTLKLEPNDMMQIPGKKELFCNIVFQQNNKEYVSKYKKFSFDVE